MAGKKNLCAMIPAELHARIMAEKEEMKLGTLAEYVERIFAEHFEGGNDMQTERTLAVKISAELFDRLKEYLEKNHLKQKDFITQLIQQALDNAEEYKRCGRSQILVQILYNRLMSGQRSPKFSCKHSGKPLNISHRERLIQSHFHPNHLNLFRRRIGYASVCNNFCRIFSGPSNQQKT